MREKIIVVGMLAAIMVSANIAYSQTVPTGEQSAFLAKAAAVLQQQRDMAMNEVVNAQAMLAVVRDENAALKARVKELETKLEPKAEDKP